jgi:hypothetical protein
MADFRSKHKIGSLEFFQKDEGEFVRFGLKLEEIIIVDFPLFKTPQVDKAVKTIINDEEKMLRTFNKSSDKKIYSASLTDHADSFPDGGEQLLGKNMQDWNVICPFPGEKQSSLFLFNETAQELQNIWSKLMSRTEFTNAFFLEIKESKYGAYFPSSIHILDYGVVRWSSAKKDWIVNTVPIDSEVITVDAQKLSELDHQSELTTESDFESLKLLNLDHFDKMSDFVHRKDKFAAQRLKKLLKMNPNKLVEKFLGKDMVVEEQAALLESVNKLQTLAK